MKPQRKLAIAFGVAVLLWVPLATFCMGEDMSRPGRVLGGVVVFAPLFAVITFFIIDHED